VSIPGTGAQTLEDVHRRIVDALAAMLSQAEQEPPRMSAVEGSGLTAVFEHAGVRCVLVVDLTPERAALSPRELQIARLVARGATNRAIGSTLEISSWTVSTHLRRIFAKLGVNSRAEMVNALFAVPEIPGQRKGEGRGVVDPVNERALTSSPEAPTSTLIDVREVMQ
jgi:DNA-binding CsgD family transcriptional regulator